MKHPFKWQNLTVRTTESAPGFDQFSVRISYGACNQAGLLTPQLVFETSSNQIQRGVFLPSAMSIKEAKKQTKKKNT